MILTTKMKWMTMSANLTLRTASEIEQERLAFKADRYGHNNAPTAEQFWSRVTYMCHAGGYVMARRPRCSPFVITEKLWRSFAPWKDADAEIPGSSK
jgi:hypothetical protein